MSLFRMFLALIFAIIAVYTLITISQHGLGLFNVFFGDITKMAWPGQFNLDFLCMLVLSGLWVAWRHGFSASGLGLGILAFLGGAFFLSAYLLYHSFKTKGDMRALLLGMNRS